MSTEDQHKAPAASASAPDGRAGAGVDPKSEGSIGEMVKTVSYALLIALVIRAFLFQPFNIPSGSMLPTLFIGDYVFVSKYAYGYSRYSLPFSPNLFSGRIMEGAPERGDVVVFRKPTEPSIDYIKRIVGLPGDRIQVIDGVLHLNGEPVKHEANGTTVVKEGDGIAREIAVFKETLPNGRTYLTLNRSDHSSGDNTGVYVVPADHYFAMGDNRDNSVDSRFADVGYVPAANLVGRAEVIFFSLEGDTHFWEVWKWPWKLRLSRFFTGLEPDGA